MLTDADGKKYFADRKLKNTPIGRTTKDQTFSSFMPILEYRGLSSSSERRAKSVGAVPSLLLLDCTPQPDKSLVNTLDMQINAVGLHLNVSKPTPIKNIEQLAIVDEFRRKEVWPRDGNRCRVPAGDEKLVFLFENTRKERLD